MTKAHAGVGIALLAAALSACVLLLFWVALLLAPQLLTSKLGATFPWPIACTVRGCVTSQHWNELVRADADFAATTNQAAASPDAVLTTLIRQLLVHQALPSNTISQADIDHYQSEVLHLTDEQTIQQTTSLAPKQYEQLVIRPFLEQQALKELRKSASLEDLFRQLSKERQVFVLPKGWQWDTEKAAVVRI